MRITVRVSPGRKTESIKELSPGVFAVSVKEKPIQGKATFAVFRVLAEHFHVSLSRITLFSGATSRDKIFDISI